MTDSNDKETVLAANQSFYRAFSDLDLREMTSLWWQGSTSLCIHPGTQPILGWEQIKQSWEAIFRNANSLEIDIEILRVEVDRSIAYVVVREIVLTSANRGRNIKAQSIATNVFQKMAQRWYLVSHHGSPIIR